MQASTTDLPVDERAEHYRKLAWTRFDWSECTLEELRVVVADCERQIDAVRYAKQQAHGRIAKERRKGRSHRYGWRWVVYTFPLYRGSDEREEGACVTWTEASALLRRRIPKRWAERVLAEQGAT